MIRLFIELYLDEDVNVLIANLVRSQGFNAITARDAGMLNRTDPEQLVYAVTNHKTLVTHNRTDYEALARDYFLMGQNHFGLILAIRRSPYEILNRLLYILNTVTADEMENQIRYI